MNRIFKLTGFLPFLAILFLNAFVDLGHKIVIQNTIFKIHDGHIQIILTAIVNGLILLPFVLLFTPAGFLSDRYRKPRVMQVSALVAVVLTLLITLSYYFGWYWTSFALTFLLATQSALYSPAKYGYIKELAGNEQLTFANAAVQAVTIIAILSGIFAFSLLFEQFLSGASYQNESQLLQAIAPVGWMLVICSLLEFALTFRLPMQTAGQEQPFDWKRYGQGGYLAENLRTIRGNRVIWLSIVGLSVFWGISQVVLAAFPAFAKEVLLEMDTRVVQGLLAASGIGIMIGSVLAGKASKHHIETGLLPVGAAGVVISLFLLPQLDSRTLMALDILAFGVFGGLFIVPLNALIQFHARDEQLGTVLAGNNWIQNIVMLSFLGLTVGFALSGTGSIGLLYLTTLVALIGAIYTLYQLPQSLVRYLTALLFSVRYRVRILGFNRIPEQGGVLMLGNHISWLDWAMVQIACPRPVRFVMQKEIYERWYLKWFLELFGAIPISSGQSKTAIQRISQLLAEGEVVCLFPEGAISRTGHLGEFKKGYERAIKDTDALILPFYLRGLWGSRFSRSNERPQIGKGMKREIIIAFGEPLPASTPVETLKQRVFDLSIEAWEGYAEELEPIPLAWIRSAKRTGRTTSLMDSIGTSLSGYRTLTAVTAFARLMEKRSPEQNIGLLLPTSSAGIIANMAALLRGRTVINLNYTANIDSLLAAVEKAEIRSVYTSSRFLKKLEQRGMDLGPVLEKVQVIPMEELKEEIGLATKISILLLAMLLPARLFYLLFGKRVDADQPATILFSSGSEGQPKGVVLSHRNLMGNIKQVADVLNTEQQDVIMSSLPLFHAFGLTVTSLLPLVEGIPALCHPDPTDTLSIAKAVSRYRGTILFGTSTFLRLFVRNRRVHPAMLDSLRLVVAGAEKLNGEVRNSFQLKFNKPVYEGYGATETSPVASVNIPDQLDQRSWNLQPGNRLGTVGMPLPGSSIRIVDPETLETLPSGEEGLILIGGVQVMSGYLNDPEKTAEVIVQLDGTRWYKTGDKGRLDEDGFLTIVDRYSRFAKIGGEMVSLGAVEEQIGHELPEEVEIATVALPDGKKGEKIVLLYAGEITLDAIKQTIAASGLNPLMVPSEYLEVDAIPKLGSGKQDFSQAKKLAIGSNAA